MITTKERSQLKAIAQNMKPALNIGKSGITDNTILEINNYLEKNEVMKIKLLQNFDGEAKETMDCILEKTQSEPVLMIGNMLIIYKKSSDKKAKHVLG